MSIVLASILTGCEPAAPTLMSEVQVPRDAKTLSEAMSLVAPGGVISIAPGNYKEQLEVTKPNITIRGEDRNLTIIDGGGTRPYGIVVTADGVRVENLTITGATFYGLLITGMHDESGVKPPGTSGYTNWDPSKYPPLQRYLVDHVTAYNNGLYGIYALNSQHGVIRDSYTSGSADSGIYVGQCENCDVLITGNVAERNAVGFENANASDSVVIVGNRFSSNRIGLTLLSSYREAFTPQRGNKVVGNVISNNVEADSPSQAEGAFGIGIGISGGQSNLILRNLLTGNPKAGIVITNTEDIPSINNEFESNQFDPGVSIANLSTTRAAAKANCWSEASATIPTSFASDLIAACSGSSAAQSYAESLTGPAAPPGVSFLKVAPPKDQPQLPRAAKYDPLPNAISFPDLDSVLLPDSALLAELSGSK
ncbi:MAG: right-handed parallel beta-helix repeat-containing protein [Cryobacterium sp.]|nr:right-handed parallel beta-helix repeat-containing protein [Cryobacterium sp.]